MAKIKKSKSPGEQPRRLARRADDPIVAGTTPQAEGPHKYRIGFKNPKPTKRNRTVRQQWIWYEIEADTPFAALEEGLRRWSPNSVQSQRLRQVCTGTLESLVFVDGQQNPLDIREVMLDSPGHRMFQLRRVRNLADGTDLRELLDAVASAGIRLPEDSILRKLSVEILELQSVADDEYETLDKAGVQPFDTSRDDDDDADDDDDDMEEFDDE